MTDNLIIFLATESYLSCPQYFAILPYLENCKKIILNVNEQVSSNLDKIYLEKNQKKILKYFDKYHELQKFNFKGKKRLWNVLWIHFQYKKMIFKYLDTYHPQAIICCTDMSLSDRMIFTWCRKNSIPYIILQPSFLDSIISKQEYGIRYKIKYYLTNKILRIPVFRRQPFYGNETQNAHLFLWSEYFVENQKKKKYLFLRKSRI